MKRLTLLALLVGSVGVGGCGDNKVANLDPDAGPRPDGPPTVTPIPLDRAHAGGSPGPLVIVDGKAYVGVGPRLAIWDLAAGTLVGESPPLRGNIDAVAIVGDRAFVAERTDLDSMLHVLDLSNPAAIIETKLLDLAAVGGGSVIHDIEPGANDRLYVSDQEQGVFELDITDPDAPTTVRLAPLPGVGELQLSGTRLYHWGGGFGGTAVGALDTTMALKVIGSTNLPVESIALTGNLAVGAGIDGIFVFDLTNVNTPVQRFRYSKPDGGPFARAVTVAGTRAWIPAEDGLHVLNLTVPLAITRTLHAHDVVGVNAATSAGGTLAITTDRGRLHLFDVSAPAPANPRALDVTLCADCVGVTANEETVFVADIVGGLRTAKLTNLDALGRSPAIPALPDAGGLAFVFEDVTIDAAGTRAFVADWLFGLRVYDITDPAAIAEVGTLDTAGSPSGIALANDRAYITEGTGGGYLRAIDIANPTMPTELGFVETSKAWKVSVRGTLAYVADEEVFGPGGLKVFDVKNPASLALQGTYMQDCPAARDVELIGNHAIVACSFDGFHLVDITDPTAPVRAAVIPAPGISSAWSVATYEGHVVLGHDHGVVLVDISNPATPREIASYPTAFTVRALAVPQAGRIVAAAGPGGVYQWQLP